MDDPIQFIRDGDGKPSFVVLPIADYQRLVEAADETLGRHAYDTYRLDKPETFPAEVADRLIAGDSPIRVFRSYRGLSQAELAARVGISQVTISQLETGRRQGSVDVLRAVAGVLGVEIDDLVIDQTIPG